MHNIVADGDQEQALMEAVQQAMLDLKIARNTGDRRVKHAAHTRLEQALREFNNFLDRKNNRRPMGVAQTQHWSAYLR